MFRLSQPLASPWLLLGSADITVECDSQAGVHFPLCLRCAKEICTSQMAAIQARSKQ